MTSNTGRLGDLPKGPQSFQLGFELKSGREGREVFANGYKFVISKKNFVDVPEEESVVFMDASRPKLRRTMVDH